jgi:hypothetical protein
MNAALAGGFGVVVPDITGAVGIEVHHVVHIGIAVVMGNRDDDLSHGVSPAYSLSDRVLCVRWGARISDEWSFSA